MTRTRIKICGITCQEDAEAAIRAGADAIGFVLWPASPRAVSLDRAAGIARDAALVARVGVFVDSSPADVAEAVRHAKLDAVQLHGDERVEEFKACGAPLIKSVTLVTESDVGLALAMAPDVTLLIDTSDPDRRGGTGRVSDWSLARRVAAERPAMLAGGLNPANVAQAIKAVRPWAVDVSSGVERAPGRKDAEAIASLCKAVSLADREAM